MTIKEMFIDATKKAMVSAELISEPSAKSQAYSAIALAIAETGLVGRDEEVAPTKEDLKQSNTKGKNKTKVEEVIPEFVPEQKEETPIQEEKIPEQKEEVQDQADATDVPDEVWTDSAIEKYAEEIAFAQKGSEEIGEEAFNECIRTFSENLGQDINFLNPANIKGFVIYLKCYLREKNS